MHFGQRLALIYGVLLVLTVPLARAEIYRDVDENGVLHFTNIQPTKNGKPPVDRIGKRTSKAQNSEPEVRQKLRTPSVGSRHDLLIQEAARQYNIPQSLIRAVMAVESNFKIRAVSRVGAQGLMQLMPATAAQMGVGDSFNPRQNVLGGTRYLRLLADAYDGNLVLTLAAYNAGQSAVNKYRDIPPYRETQRYVRRVLSLYAYYKKLHCQTQIDHNDEGVDDE